MRQLRDNLEYAFPLFCFAVAVPMFIRGDTDGGLTATAIGVASAIVFWLMKESGVRYHSGPRIRRGSQKVPPYPMTFEEGELKVLSGGMEPVPIPGEAEEHAKSCTFCKRWEETR